MFEVCGLTPAAALLYSKREISLLHLLQVLIPVLRKSALLRRTLATGVPSLLMVLAVGCSTPESPTPPTGTRPTGVPTAELLHEGYVGAKACQPCHQELYATWDASAHGHAMAEPSPETVVGDFLNPGPIQFRGVTYRPHRSGDDYVITIESPGEEPESYRIDLLIGAIQAQGYLTRLPDGRYQELPIAINRRSGAWIEASAGGTLKDAAPLDPTNFYHWKSPGRTWNQRCYNCHLSQMVQNYDPETDTYATAWVDLSINCESCHGPGKEHVDFWNESVQGAFRPPEADTSLVKLQGLPGKLAVYACVQCHAKKTFNAVGFQPGDEFHDFYEPALLDDPSIWPDGLFKAESYTYIGYLLNQCYLKGGLTCTQCHDPHGSAHGVDLLTSWEESDRLCARCHPDLVSEPLPHTHHRVGTVGSRCLDCHMPQYELKEFLVPGVVLTDHRLASPVPENTIRFGIPNACGTVKCHADKTTEWASEWSNKWYGAYQDESVARTTTIHLGQTGNPEGLGPLVELLANQDEPEAIRASAATLIGGLQSEDAVPHLAAALQDASSLVRARAALALGRVRSPSATAALSNVLTDPNPFVRINAVMAVNALAIAPPTDEHKQALIKGLDEYVDLLSGLWATDPAAAVTLGDLHMRDGRPEEAAASYERALAKWPHDPDALIRLAKIRLQSGDLNTASEHVQHALRLRPNDAGARALQEQIASPAIAQLQYQVEINPTSARARHNLATYYAQQGRLDEAIAEYSEAIRLKPDYASAYRNMGLAQANGGKLAEAIESLNGYLRAAPQAEDANQVRKLIQRLQQ